MQSSEIIHKLADVSAILTCLFVVVGYLKYQVNLYQKSKRLERYLASKQGGNAQHTTFNIISQVGLTQEEIVQISFRNKHVARRVHKNPATGKADELLFEYLP